MESESKENGVSRGKGNYVLLREVDDARFGRVGLLHSPGANPHMAMEKRKTCVTREEFERDMAQANERLGLESRGLLRFLGFSTREQDGTFEVAGLYEFLPHHLAADLADRATKVRPYPGELLQRMAEDLLTALAYLQSRRLVHGDLRPLYVGLSKEYRATLVDRLADPSAPTRAQANCLKHGRTLYMSPSLFAGLASGARGARHNPFKSDLFSLGLVLLEAGLLGSVQEIFDLPNQRVNPEKLLCLLRRLEQIYPDQPKLRSLLQAMLEFDESARPHPQALLARIQKEEELSFVEGSYSARSVERGHSGGINHHSPSPGPSRYSDSPNPPEPQRSSEHHGPLESSKPLEFSEPTEQFNSQKTFELSRPSQSSEFQKPFEPLTPSESLKPSEPHKLSEPQRPSGPLVSSEFQKPSQTFVSSELPDPVEQNKLSEIRKASGPHKVSEPIGSELSSPAKAPGSSVSHSHRAYSPPKDLSQLLFATSSHENDASEISAHASRQLPGIPDFSTTSHLRYIQEQLALSPLPTPQFDPAPLLVDLGTPQDEEEPRPNRGLVREFLMKSETPEDEEGTRANGRLVREFLLKSDAPEIVENNSEVYKNTPDVCEDTPELYRNTSEIYMTIPEYTSDIPEVDTVTREVFRSNKDIQMVIPEVHTVPLPLHRESSIDLDDASLKNGQDRFSSSDTLTINIQLSESDLNPNLKFRDTIELSLPSPVKDGQSFGQVPGETTQSWLPSSSNHPNPYASPKNITQSYLPSNSVTSKLITSTPIKSTHTYVSTPSVIPTYSGITQTYVPPPTVYPTYVPPEGVTLIGSTTYVPSQTVSPVKVSADSAPTYVPPEGVTLIGLTSYVPSQSVSPTKIFPPTNSPTQIPLQTVNTSYTPSFVSPPRVSPLSIVPNISRDEPEISLQTIPPPPSTRKASTQNSMTFAPYGGLGSTGAPAPPRDSLATSIGGSTFSRAGSPNIMCVKNSLYSALGQTNSQAKRQLYSGVYSNLGTSKVEGSLPANREGSPMPSWLTAFGSPKSSYSSKGSILDKILQPYIGEIGESSTRGSAPILEQPAVIPVTVDSERQVSQFRSPVSNRFAGLQTSRGPTPDSELKALPTPRVPANPLNSAFLTRSYQSPGVSAARSVETEGNSSTPQKRVITVPSSRVISNNPSPVLVKVTPNREIYRPASIDQRKEFEIPRPPLFDTINSQPSPRESSSRENEVLAFSYRMDVDNNSSSKRYVLSKSNSPLPLSQVFTQSKSDPNVPGDSALNHLYGNVELRVEDPNYKVFRIVENGQLSSPTRVKQYDNLEKSGRTYTVVRGGKEFKEQFNLVKQHLR